MPREPDRIRDKAAKRSNHIEANGHHPGGGSAGCGLFGGGGPGAAGTLDGFLAWAWERHHNVLSWYVRLLFILPLAYFSYKRSLSSIVLTLVALATSMFWFPAPEHK